MPGTGTPGAAGTAGTLNFPPTITGEPGTPQIFQGTPNQAFNTLNIGTPKSLQRQPRTFTGIIPSEFQSTIGTPIANQGAQGLFGPTIGPGTPPGSSPFGLPWWEVIALGVGALALIAVVLKEA